MRVTMRFGRNGLELRLPEAWDVSVLRALPMTPAGDPSSAVAGALDTPVGSDTLEAEARGQGSACILICDITRPVPNRLVLRPLVERLASAGVPLERITILVATGLHRPNLGGELAEVIGDPWVMEHVRIENHFARRDADHAELGTTSGGIPVRLDRRFLEAGVRIAVGLVEPHFMAGYSGGRKLLTPGIAHADTIRALHAAGILSHPLSTSCVLDGNPVHGAQEEALAMAGRCLGFSFVIDDGRRPCFASFGGIGESHRAAVSYIERHCRVPVPEPFPVVVTSGAGYPLDATYYQTVKAIAGAAPILSPGGLLLAVAECSEGMGSEEFRVSQRLLREKGISEFRRECLGRGMAEIDEWETVMLMKALEKGNVGLFAPGLPAGDRELTGARVIESVERELARAVEADPRRRLAVIPEGPYVVPFLTSLAPGRST